MLTEERLNKILDLLNKQGRVKSKHLAEILSVSEVTIRNDLNILEKKGLLSRVHGGAVSMKGGYYYPHQTNYYPYLRKDYHNRPRIFDPHFQEQIALDKEEKKEIAKKAVSVVEKNDVIFVDSGSSTLFFVEELIKNPPFNLTIVTNSLYVINEVVQYNNVNLLVLGGLFQRSSLNFLDFEISPLIEKYCVNKIFLGANGMDESGLYSINIMEAKIKKEICNLSAQLFVLISSSKIFRKSLKLICNWKGNETIIVSEKAELYKDRLSALEKNQNIKII
ncbi:MAG: DeoR family transcriptional regulator, fructose operon transcriptional repressor [Kosmotogales bacterium]|nr:DeoR family transcriptional regulator, fructose operon transcriptional repressor [Kosmotogales bacterium]